MLSINVWVVGLMASLLQPALLYEQCTNFPPKYYRSNPDGISSQKISGLWGLINHFLFSVVVSMTFEPEHVGREVRTTVRRTREEIEENRWLVQSCLVIHILDVA